MRNFFIGWTKSEDTDWMPSESIINYLRKLIIAEGSSTEKFLLTNYVVQGIHHASGDKDDLCMDCELKKILFSTDAEYLLIPYINKIPGVAPHYQFIQVDLIGKLIIYWDPFGKTSAGYQNWEMVLRALCRFKKFEGFKSLALSMRAQFDEYSCGDWIMQCYKWSIRYDFHNKTSAAIDDAHKYYMEGVSAYIKEKNTTIRAVTRRIISGEIVIPAVSLAGSSTKPVAHSQQLHTYEIAQQCFYELNNNKKIETIRKMTRDGMRYQYIFDVSDVNNLTRIRDYIQASPDNLATFMKLLEMLDDCTQRQIIDKVNEAYQNPILAPTLVIEIDRYEAETSVIKRVVLCATYEESLDEIITTFISSEPAANFSHCLIITDSLPSLNKQFGVPYFEIYYDIFSCLWDQGLDKAAYEKDIAFLIMTSLTSLLNSADDIHEMMKIFFGFTDESIVMMTHMQARIRQQTEQTYLVDEVTSAVSFKFSLFEKLSNESLLHFLLAHFFYNFFIICQSHVFRAVISELFFFHCFQAVGGGVNIRELSRGQLMGLMRSKTASKALQQNLLVSFLTLYGDNFNDSLREIILVAEDKVLGSSILEFCRRRKQTFSEFATPLFPSYSIFQSELLIGAVISALKSNPIYLGGSANFAAELKCFLFNIRGNDDVWLHQNEAAVLYLWRILNGLPTPSTSEIFMPLCVFILNMIREIIVQLNKDVLLQDNFVACYFIGLDKFNQHDEALKFVNLVLRMVKYGEQSSTKYSDFFVESFTQLLLKAEVSGPVYCLLLDGMSALIRIIYAAKSRDVAIEVARQFFSKGQIPENKFGMMDEDYKLIVSRLVLLLSRFSGVEIQNFFTIIAENHSGVLFSQALLYHLLSSIREEESLTCGNIFKFLAIFWRRENLEESNKYNLMRTLDHLKLIKVQDGRAHQKIAIIMLSSFEKLRLVLNAEPRDRETLDFFTRMISLFFLSLKNSTKDPVLAPILKDSYGSMYTVFFTKYDEKFRDPLITRDTRRILGSFFTSARRGIFSKAKGVPERCLTVPGITTQNQFP